MKDAENMSPGSLIKAGVSEHVEQQQQNPNAISNGVNVHKAFDTDPHGLHSSSQVNEDADKIAQPISSLHISPEAESPSTGKESVQARAEAEQLDADSSSPPSHPNIDIVSPEDAKFQEGSKSGPDDQGRADENAQAAEAEFGQKKKKKKKPKSQRGLVDLPLFYACRILILNALRTLPLVLKSIMSTLPSRQSSMLRKRDSTARQSPILPSVMIIANSYEISPILTVSIVYLS